MLGHLVYNGQRDDGGYTFPTATHGWFTRLWHALLHLTSGTPATGS